MSKMPDLKNRFSSITEAEADCEDCDWETRSVKNALANASLHARRTGHTVRCRQTTAVTYNQKDE